MFNISTNFYLLEIKDKIKQFNDDNDFDTKISFIWIPAHKEIQGNEFADTEAKLATHKIPSSSPIPFTDLTHSLRNRSFLLTKNLIQEQGFVKGIEYFKYFYKDTNKPWFHNKKPRTNSNDQ